MPVIVEARHLGGRALRLRFADGAEGELDLAGLLMNLPLPHLPRLSPEQLARLEEAIGAFTLEGGTLAWPGVGAPFSAELLRGRLVTGRVQVRVGRPGQPGRVVTLRGPHETWARGISFGADPGNDVVLEGLRPFHARVEAGGHHLFLLEPVDGPRRRLGPERSFDLGPYAVFV